MRVPGVAILVLLLLASDLSAAEPNKLEWFQALEKQLVAAHETAGPAVACVVVSKSDRYPKPAGESVPGKLGAYNLATFLAENPNEKRLALSLDLSDPKSILDHGYACGVVIDSAGLVLTPYHVVEGATKVYVHLPGRLGSYADIHAADARHDLAVLKLINPPAKLTAIKFANVRLDHRNGIRPTVSPGKFVVLMANVHVTGFVLDKPSGALGTITNIRPRNDQKTSSQTSDSYYNFGQFLEHDARINATVSGAALLNLDGEMVGLTTSTVVPTGGERSPAYAFPTDESFRRVVEVLRRGEEVDYGYLGVTLTEGRFAIGGVAPLGPAAQAGIEPGDVITQINGVTISGYPELLVHIGSALADAKVKLTISRLGREREVTVTLGKFDHKQPLIASVRPDAVFGLRVEYGSILAQRLRGDLRVQGNGVPAGVCVREIVPNSPAAAAFKKLGDRPERWLITQINGTGIATPAEFYKAAKDQKTLKLTVIDPTELNRKEYEVTLP